MAFQTQDGRQLDWHSTAAHGQTQHGRNLWTQPAPILHIFSTKTWPLSVGQARSKSMKFEGPFLFALILGVITSTIASAQTSPPAQSQLLLGAWALGDPNDTAFKFEPCGPQFCARVVALGAPGPDSVAATDTLNPNPALRNRPVCGMQVIRGLTADQNGWRGGTAYNPGDGTDVRFSIQRSRSGTLRLIVAGLPAFLAAVPLVPAARNPQRPC
jgi:hypothetical protein